MATTVFNFPSAIDRIEAKVNALAIAVATLQAGQNNLSQQGVKIMQGTSDLAAAVNELKQEVSDISAEMDSNFQKLMDALANATVPPADQAVIDQATADIRSQIDALKAAGQRDMPPAPPSP
jgi:Sec-independent protein translocase protein TatA